MHLTEAGFNKMSLSKELRARLRPDVIILKEANVDKTQEYLLIQFRRWLNDYIEQEYLHDVI